MRSRAVPLAILVAGCLATPVAAPAAPPPTTLTCGQVVTQDVVLAADVSCGPDQIDIPGLIVGADGITIDLNGHTVSAFFGVERRGGPAVLNEGHGGVTIRNGVAQGITGISLQGASGNRLVALDAGNAPGLGIEISGGSDNTVRDGRAGGIVGILVNGSPRTRVIGNTQSSLGGQPALVLGTGSDNSVVKANVALRSILGGGHIDVGASSSRIVANATSSITIAGSGNVVARNWALDADDFPPDLDGIWVLEGATNTVVRRNLAASNTGDGIRVDAASTRIVRNTAVNNGDYGIQTVPGVFSFGNVASGNGNPAQCLNVVCQPAF
jgi:parallel beta-helix repeat protein